MTFPKTLLCLILAICLALTACTTSATDTTPTLVPPTAALTYTSSPPIVTATFEPPATVEEEPTARPTFTISPAPSHVPPTATFLPTLDKIGLSNQEIVIQLLLDNGGCDWPCWWGIIPGQTSWESASGYLSGFAESLKLYQVRHKIWWYYGKFHVSVEGEEFPTYGVSFRVNSNQIVDRIYTTSLWDIETPYNNLASVLNKYGPPDEIWIHAKARTQIGPLFSYVLFWGDIGFLTLKQDLHATLVQDEYLRLCPQNFTNSPRIWVWNPEENLGFEDIADGSIINISEAVKVEYLQLEEISDMTVEEFYNVYLDPQTDFCFLIDRDPWY